MKTASLEVSRKVDRILSGAGVETEFSWMKMPTETLLFRTDIADRYIDSIPAPTACELGELLPDRVEMMGCGHYVKFSKIEHEYGVTYGCSNICFWADTLADAMGLMLVWLKENGHLEEGK